VSRIPIRLRLTATFALAMAAVLAVAGFLLYHHLATSLDRTLAQGLRARSADISALVNQADTGLREAQVRARNASGVAQVLDTRGRIVDQTPGLGNKPVLTRIQLERARRHSVLVNRARVVGQSLRLLAAPVAAQGQRLVVVVGAPLETRDNALATLRTELLVVGPVGLLLASLIGYLIAAAALRPVERMRARAAAISASRLSERLPVSPARDEVARLGDTLNEMLGRLQTALVRERSFVADASHELRTPLAHLQAEVELALESPRHRVELEAALRSVGSETDRLSQLTADLLLLARVDEGALPIRRGDVELGDLVESVVSRFGRRAKEDGREIEIDSKKARIRVDRLRLEQALGNLIENAYRHGSGVIRVSAALKGDSLELHVTDEGSGIAPEFAPRAFDRFSRGDQSRTSGGAGLGLAIVAAVAAAHGGSVAIAKTNHGGADVSIRLPDVQERSTSEANAAFTPSPDTPPSAYREVPSISSSRAPASNAP
jgi:two-component system, OmpR family, sensor kinase